MKKLLLLLLISTSVNSSDTFLYGNLGIGAYAKGLGRPEITTPQTLGAINLGMGYEFENDVDVRLGFEHWSSLQGFPNVFDSPDEDGHGFNALWLKVEKRFYLSK